MARVRHAAAPRNRSEFCIEPDPAGLVQLRVRPSEGPEGLIRGLTVGEANQRRLALSARGWHGTVKGR